MTSDNGGQDMASVEDRAHYRRGWAASERFGKGITATSPLERADERGEVKAWYLGYEDHAAGRPKWSAFTGGRPVVSVENVASDPTYQPHTLTDAEYAAFIDVPGATLAADLTTSEPTTIAKRFDQLDTGDRIYWSSCDGEAATVTRGYDRVTIDAPVDVEITFSGSESGEQKTFTCELAWKASTPVNVYVSEPEAAKRCPYGTCDTDHDWVAGCVSEATALDATTLDLTPDYAYPPRRRPTGQPFAGMVEEIHGTPDPADLADENDGDDSWMTDEPHTPYDPYTHPSKRGADEPGAWPVKDDG